MLKKIFNRLKNSFSDTVLDPLDALALTALIKLNLPAKKIDLNSRKLVSTTLAGDKLAKFRGRGMDFDESRVYQTGDDIRSIDWRVTARSGTTHTKIYREERERPVYCFVDCSDSMWFGTQNNFKAVIAAQAASLIAWAASDHGDRIGGVICSEKNIWGLKPAAGKRGVLQLLSLLAKQRPLTNRLSDPDVVAKALLQLRQVAKPGSLIFLLTDGHNLTTAAEQHLASLSKHCQLLFGFIYDPLEMHLPPSGRYSFTDGQQTVTYDTADKKLCESYYRNFMTHFETIKQLANRYQIPLFSLPTNESPADTLAQVFTAKKNRKANVH